jgi:hypothetical protein
MKNSGLRVISILLALTFFMAVLTGCSASRPIKSTDEELAVIGQVGTFDVLYEELRYVTMNYKNQFKVRYGEGIWDNEETAAKYRAELEETVFQNITVNYAVLSLCAEAGISIENETIQSAVKDYFVSLVDEVGGRSNYRKSLEENYATDHFMRFTIGVDYCQNELFYVYTEDLALIEKDEEKIYDIIMAGNFVRTLHVYIQNDAGDDVAANRKKAEEVRGKLLAGTDIKTIIGSSVNEDFNLTSTDGYYFTRGEMVKSYEDAAFALNIGGISEVVETDSGFYVIERLALETSYVLANLSDLAQQYQYARLNEFIDAEQARLTLTLNDYGKSIDLTKIN